MKSKVWAVDIVSDVDGNTTTITVYRHGYTTAFLGVKRHEYNVTNHRRINRINRVLGVAHNMFADDGRVGRFWTF